MYLGSCIYDIGNDILPGQYFKGVALTYTLSDIPYIPIPKWNIHSKLTVLRADGTAVACIGNTLEFTNA